jgi:CelD/BcsL family acetyltransferase involved in cellulose biosynthesis
LKIVCVDPRTDRLWWELVNRASSSVFHSPAWIRVLADTYSWQPSAYVVVDDQGEPQAGLPLCRISDIFGSRIVALPFSDYCDPLIISPAAWRPLAAAVLSEGLPVALRCLHNDQPLADGQFTVVKQAKWHALDLRADVETLWNRIDDSAHRAIRKSQRSGICIRAAESERELRAFFEMHLKIRKNKYGLLAQPFSFFQNIWRHFMEKKLGYLLLALNGDTIVAGDLFLQWKSTLYYKFNASLFDNLSCRPNDLLIWEAMQCGKKRGFTSLDLGLSDWDQTGLVRYKRKFGAEEKTIFFLRHGPVTPPTGVDAEMRALLAKLTTRFTDHMVPDCITERAGEDLYRLFT